MTILFSMLLSACSGVNNPIGAPYVLPTAAPVAQAPTATERVIVVTATNAPTAIAAAPVVQPTATLVAPTATSVPTVQPTVAAARIVTCDAKSVPVPINGQVFEATVAGTKNHCYDMVYDPSQSGAADLPAKGWWYQPLLPGPSREAHEVAITLQQGTYRFVGPECTVWLNYDGNHPFDQGKLLVERQNIDKLVVDATQNHGTESWIFARCKASDASGFSFALR